MTLIELDLDATPGPAPGRQPPPWRYRRTGLLVAVVLVIALGGAAPAAGMFWRLLGEVAGGNVAESPAQLVGGRIYTLSATFPDRELSAWDPADGLRRLWTARIVAPRDAVRGLFLSRITVSAAGDVVLVGDRLNTTALDAADGHTRWTRTSPVTPLAAGGTGIVTDVVFRAGTEYDQESGDPGMLYFSADGAPHTEPPIRTDVRGVDLVTGQVLWTAQAPGSVNVEPAVAGQPSVLITSATGLELRDGRSGTVVRAAALPKVAGSWPSNGAILGDVVLVRYDQASRQVGYDLRTLEQLWSRDIPDMQAEPADCDQVLCAGDRGDLSVLDPRTARPVWTVVDAVDLSMRAGHVLETDAETGAPLRLADAHTGRIRRELSGWSEALDGPAAGPLVLRRTAGDGEAAFGAVPPGHAEVRLLGAARVGDGDCQADDRYVVCPNGQDLRIWAYRF
ncbi:MULTISPECIES: PQQ-binding-like beta-propeller repeat protein [Actinoplanes]|uniref:outer membrane protein assembly factor BamB family protein n=1 Tax=Actinoplanes TaxID=1865 RepID=UPI0005F284DB|nr:MULTISPECIES: PQQ-binding-like beta-propeller repeat protein [Actinoplanes]GLY04684.1 hypothetical protein Acsp01_50630 [Actinoplanes sp. NBRC 101535]